MRHSESMEVATPMGSSSMVRMLFGDCDVDVICLRIEKCFIMIVNDRQWCVLTLVNTCRWNRKESVIIEFLSIPPSTE